MLNGCFDKKPLQKNPAFLWILLCLAVFLSCLPYQSLIPTKRIVTGSSSSLQGSRVGRFEYPDRIHEDLEKGQSHSIHTRPKWRNLPFFPLLNQSEDRKGGIEYDIGDQSHCLCRRCLCRIGLGILDRSGFQIGFSHLNFIHIKRTPLKTVSFLIHAVFLNNLLVPAVGSLHLHLEFKLLNLCFFLIKLFQQSKEIIIGQKLFHGVLLSSFVNIITQKNIYHKGFSCKK